ncbi:MAG TPA: Asp-tRNA(Asn)/Glu-tRNA(Gln) amidotransferase GatCAB subunit A [Clostridiales bacterium UBA8960]|nr:Asp-tRNA(Asn)/Glu-tRNA(Gln) amidotransferase GatCAB subunit A [Clostridiales bacterium UBA8960]
MSSVELTKAYLDQIDKTDESIGAFLYLDKQGALKAAERVDSKRASGEKLSPLAGIPMALKDNLCTVDMPTTCASKMLEHFYSPYDATVVTHLRTADAIILGKLNMDEFAMGASTENSYFKKTRNPISADRVPGGSSGGSAAAVAAHQVAYTLGSDTGGSVRQPASFCGVVGLKPTYGRISRRGLIAFASSLDQIGPIGKSVEDVTEIYKHLAIHDPLDSTSGASEALSKSELLSKDISKMRIALPKSFFEEGIQQEVKEAVLAAAKIFESLGAVVEEVDLRRLDSALPSYYLLSSAEASSNLARFDGVKYGFRADEFDSIESLYKKTRGEGFGREVKRRIMLGTYALSSGYYDAYYQKALKVRSLVKMAYDKVFASYDFVLTPVAPTTAYPFGSKEKNPIEMYLGDIYTVPVNIAGVPAISINCGYDGNHLPIGMQLIGKAFDERTILSAAHAFEETKKLWRVAL